MNNQTLPIRAFLLIMLTSFHLFSFSQSNGNIIRQATALAGRSVMDPNSDVYTSATTAGFNGNDVANSEISYYALPAFSAEPYGDIRRGPDRKFTDFIPDANNRGYYMYFNGTSLLFRFRLGAVVPGSKGYSVLIDSDGKMGSSGANADPNYVAATTGSNGNPGFEIEIVLETNSRLAIYNVDGTSSPVLVKQYAAWEEYSQVSIAGTFDNGDPDFFIDFYIPFSDLSGTPFNVTTSSPLRMSATTVMSPQAAIGGPKSDIYGLNDDLYSNPMDQYEAYVNAQKPFSLADVSSSGGGFSVICTAPPVLNEPITAGTVTVSGTWTRSALAASTGTATITVYKNGIQVGQVLGIASGASWAVPGIVVTGNDVITAKAQVGGESLCLQSNAVLVRLCSAANTSSTAGAAFTCNTSRRGMSGSMISGAVVKLYTLSAGGTPVLFATDGSVSSPSGFLITYSGGTWAYNGSNNSGSADPCSGGPNDIPDGSYFFTVTESGKCESAPVYGACINLTATATPVITPAVVYSSQTSLAGTAVAGSTVRLYQNGALRSTVTATGGNYTFTGLSFTNGDLLQVTAQATSQCISAMVTRTVTCNTTPPVVLADGNAQVAAGAAISGTSSEPAGAVIRIYSGVSTLVGTTAVQPGGTWTSSQAGTIPAPFTAVAATTYYVTAQNGGCSVSNASASVSAVGVTSLGRCGTISGPVAAAATSISGTLASAVSGTSVHLYLDGVLIGTTTTGTTAWGPIAVNTTASNTLYPNGILGIGVQETGKQEVLCTTSSTTIACASSPATPVLSSSNITIFQNQQASFTITNAVAGAYYGIADASTGGAWATGVVAPSSGNLVQPTYTFTSPNTYSLVLKATVLSGLSMCVSPGITATVQVQAALPVKLIYFSGVAEQGEILLGWKTASEENFSHFVVERSRPDLGFAAIGKVSGSGNAHGIYSFNDKNTTAGAWLYRLKMVDVDGSFSYSSVLSFPGKTTGTALYGIAPNPFQSSIKVQVAAEKKQQVPLKITGMAGNTVLQQLLSLEKGVQWLDVQGMDNLSPGVYFLQLSIDGKQEVRKIVKK